MDYYTVKLGRFHSNLQRRKTKKIPNAGHTMLWRGKTGRLASWSLIPIFRWGLQKQRVWRELKVSTGGPWTHFSRSGRNCKPKKVRTRVNLQPRWIGAHYGSKYPKIACYSRNEGSSADNSGCKGDCSVSLLLRQCHGEIIAASYDFPARPLQGSYVEKRSHRNPGLSSTKWMDEQWPLPQSIGTLH